MTKPYRKTATSKQLEVAFDAARRPEIQAEPRLAVTSLAILLTEAAGAGAGKTEPSDEGR